MIITPHLLLGAAIGAKIRSIGWIIVLGLISHLILDRIPHWDYGEKIEKLQHKKFFNKPLLIEFSKMGIDGLVSLIIVIPIIWLGGMMNLSYLPFILVGVFFSLLSDFVLGAVKLFSCVNKFKKFSKSYINFHDKILHYPKHIRKPTPLGVGTQILVSIIAVLILLL